MIIRNYYFKNNDLEGSSGEEYKNVLKNQFWSNKFISES